jgi:putative transposase
MNELRTQGVGDILIAVGDGLKGFPGAINAVFACRSASCISFAIPWILRHGRTECPLPPRRRRSIGRKTPPRAVKRSTSLTPGHGARNTQSSRKVGDETGSMSSHYLLFPLRCAGSFYATNAIEALNGKLRCAERTRGLFRDEAAMKLLYLVLRQVAGKWKMPPREWCEAKANTDGLIRRELVSYATSEVVPRYRAGHPIRTPRIHPLLVRGGRQWLRRPDGGKFWHARQELWLGGTAP